MNEIVVLQGSEDREGNVGDNEYPGDSEDNGYCSGGGGSGALVALQYYHCDGLRVTLVTGNVLPWLLVTFYYGNYNVLLVTMLTVRSLDLLYMIIFIALKIRKF